MAARRTRKTLATRENSPQGADDMMDGRDSASIIAEAQSKRKLDEPAAVPPSKKSRTGIEKGGRATRATGTGSRFKDPFTTGGKTRSTMGEATLPNCKMSNPTWIVIEEQKP